MGADSRKAMTRIRAGTLRDAMKDVAGVVQARNTIPILSHVMIEVRDGKIALTGSDLDIWCRRDLATDDRNGPGSAEWLAGIKPFTICLPAKSFGDVLAKTAADAMVTIEAPDVSKDRRAVVKAGRARFQLPCLPTDDFPLPPPLEIETSFEIPCSQLADAFAAVEHAISSEETRYYLNGVFMHTAQAEGEPLWLRLATTDGHRMARLSLDPPEGAACWPATIVQRLTVGLLDKLLANAAKTEAEAAVVLVEACRGLKVRVAMPAADGGEIEVIAKTVDGQFPDYERVIPADPPLRAVIDRVALIEGIERVGIMAEGKSRIIRAEFGPDRLRLVGQSPELGEGEEEFECAYAGEPMTVGFDVRYMLSALKALASDHVRWGFTDGGSPVRITANAGAALHDDETGPLVQVVMPARV